LLVKNGKMQGFPAVVVHGLGLDAGGT